MRQVKVKADSLIITISSQPRDQMKAPTRSVYYWVSSVEQVIDGTIGDHPVATWRSSGRWRQL